MARIVTSGAEIYVSASTVGPSPPDGISFPSAGATITRDTTVKQSPGLASFRVAATASSGVVQFPFAGVLDRVYFYRFYINIPNGTAPNAATNICGTNVSGHLQLTTAGKLVPFNNGAVASAAINDGNWHLVEYKVKHSATQANRLWEMKVDGTVVGNGTSQTSDATAPTLFQFGINTGSITFTFNVDDVALNDDQGSGQNSYPGPGRVVLLTPTADSAIGTGWTNDAASTTNEFNSVKNTPPTGIADTTAGGGGHQIRNATANASSSYDATLKTYTAAGIGSSDTVNLVVPVAATAAPSATSAKQGLLGSVSNPAITTIALSSTGTSGAFWGGVAGGTFPAGWKWSTGTITYTPTVTLGTAPVARITQVTSSTFIADVSFLGMLVDFTPASTLTLSAGKASEGWTAQGINVTPSGHTTEAAGKATRLAIGRGINPQGAGHATAAAGKASRTTLARGANVTASGHATASAGKASRTALARGITPRGSGHATASSGKATRLAIGRGINVTASRHATASAGKASRLAIARGITLSFSKVSVGKASRTAIARGVTLTPSGHATTSPGRASRLSLGRGISPRAAGHATTSAGKASRPAIARGITPRAAGHATTTLGRASRPALGRGITATATGRAPIAAGKATRHPIARGITVTTTGQFARVAAVVDLSLVVDSTILWQSSDAASPVALFDRAALSDGSDACVTDDRLDMVALKDALR